jgi:hypothetical protein
MANLIVCFPRRPNIFMDAAMWEHRTFDSEVFTCGKFINLIPLSLIISCKRLLPIVGIKISSLSTLALKSPNLFFICSLGNLSDTFQFHVEAVIQIINFIFYWGMNVENNDMTPATS